MRSPCKKLSVALILLATALGYGTAHANESLFFNPMIGVGFNEAQGTVYRIGLEAGVFLDPFLAVGIGGYYGAGKNPTHDREIGGGPFASYSLPLIPPVLTAHLRQEINYVDVRIPQLIGTPPEYNDHRTEHGVASVTSVGLHIAFTQNFGVSGGYRLTLALTNSDIAKDRSGPYAGISIGF